MAKTNPEFDFELNLIFKNTKEPGEAFNELGNIFQSLYDYDRWMLGNINNEFTISYSLTDIEFSSIRTKIIQFLKSIPDESIKNFDWKKLLGHFLLRTKYLLLKFLESNKSIDSKEILEGLASDINLEIKELTPKTGQIIAPEINIYILLNIIENTSKVINNLPPKEEIEYKSQYGNAKVTSGIKLNKEKIISELGAKNIDNETVEILKIKKIDLLSNDAKWEFKIGTRNISAKISHQDWLDKYHKREIDIKPEDCLKVRMKTSYMYTSNNEHTEVKYEILEVLEVFYPKPDSNPNRNLFS